MGALSSFSLTEVATSVALATSFLALVSAWRAFRVSSGRRFRGLDERAKAVAFWAAWSAAQELVTPKGEIAGCLARARAALDDLAVFDDPEDAAEFMLTAPASGLKRFLLLARPRQQKTWPLQIAFYLFAAGGLALIAAAAADLSTNVQPGRILIFAGVVVFVLLLVALLRQIVLIIDGRGPPAGGSS